MLYLIWTLVGFAVAALLLVLLPCGTVNTAAGCTAGNAFLPMPTWMHTAISDAVASTKWLLFIAGDGIGAALVTVLSFILSGLVVLLLWRWFRSLPFVSKWLG